MASMFIEINMEEIREIRLDLGGERSCGVEYS